MREDRERVLSNQWNEQMPCLHCGMSEFCKYANIIKRIDFPEDIFNVTIVCKLREKYKAKEM